MKAHLKKIGISAVAIGFIMSSSLIPSTEAISVSTTAKLSVSKISKGKYGASGLNTTTFTEGEYDAFLQLEVYQSGEYLVQRKETFQTSPARLGKKAETYDFINDIECNAFAYVNGKTDSDDTVYRF